MKSAYTNRIDSDYSSEFWFFTDTSPLPLLEELNSIIAQRHSDFNLTTKGRMEPLKENLLQGSLRVSSDLKNEDEMIDTAWVAEILDAKSFFKKSPHILKDIGNMTAMLKLTALDEWADGNIMAMLEAILSLRKGLLAIPDDDGRILVFNQMEALDLLKEEIDLFATEDLTDMES